MFQHHHPPVSAQLCWSNEQIQSSGLPHCKVFVSWRDAKENDVHDKSKTLLTVPRESRIDILDKISQVVFLIRHIQTAGTGKLGLWQWLLYKNTIFQALQEKMKRNRNIAFISSKMQVMFSLYRNETVEQEPLVAEVMERWPELFLPKQASK